MLRIIAGRLRGRRIPGPRSESVRPTSNKVREAVFDILAARVPLDGMRLLDWYSGTGAVGIEALSRGAGFVEFVEKDARVARGLRQVLEDLGLSGSSRVTIGSRPAESGFDVIFADPPYAGDAPAASLSDPLAGDGLLILENDRAEPDTVPGVTPEKSYRYGKTRLHLYRKTS